MTDVWYLAGLGAQSLAALCALAGAAWIAPRRERLGPAGDAIVVGLFLAGLWQTAAAAYGGESLAAGIAESLQNLVWLVAIYRLFASDGRHISVAPVRPLATVLALVIVLHVVFQLLAWRLAGSGRHVGGLFDFIVALRLLVSVGGLLLVHNLYLGTSPRSRLALRWPAAAVGVLWAFDLNFYTVAYLEGRWPIELAFARGLATVGMAGLLSLGASRSREELKLSPSRAVTFQTASLLVIGAYFIAMFALAHWLSFVGGNFAQFMELCVLVTGSLLAVFLLPSPRLRRWLQVTLTKHLFQHRYDYRSEWLRFTRTIGSAGDTSRPLEERVVKAVADIAESPAGLLLAPDDAGELTLAAHWQWNGADVPATAMAGEGIAFFERNGFIVDLDEVRSGKDHCGEAAIVPGWLMDDPQAWALVPLLHYERLTGLVVLSRPPHARRFDWEDFDLLRVVGQQLASYLAEHAGQEALAEAHRFDDFHRRIAFVMHDIKNLASQLSLLARNAEIHAEKPAFRDDMLLTLRNSADKLNALLARLSRYGAGAVEKIEDVDCADVLKAVATRYAGQHPIRLGEVQPCVVRANRDCLEQVLVHLVQNAIDASAPDAPVVLGCSSDGVLGRVEVSDNGCGMSPDFVRTRLFKPFVSSKPGGFGIGAYEARELVRAMRGRLDVESREGLGSRFIVRLPLAAASTFLNAYAPNARKVA